MAFILLVQERSLVYFFIELSWNFLYLVMMWFGLKYWGLEAAGVAFFISYFCYFGLLWACVYHLNNFALSRKNLLITAGLATCFILIFLFVRILHSVYPMISGLVMTALCAGYSAARLSNHIKRSNDTAVAKRNL